MAQVRLENVTKVFPIEGHVLSGVRNLGRALRGEEPAGDKAGVKALNKVDLLIRRGETMSLIGPTACGKTTLLRVIAGLIAPDEGAVYFDDQDVTKMLPRERNIGMVFQEFALYPHLTSLGNLAFPFVVQQRKEEIPERVRVTSRIMGLGFDRLLGRLPRTLSIGERQRVAVARCIIREPQVFLFDEPLSNLDAKLRAQTRVEIKRLLRRFRITSVYTTHDQIEALALADRLAVMNEGRIEQVGTHGEIYDWPVNVFVAGFVGTPAMNFFRGRVEEGGLRFAGFSLPFLPRLKRRLQPGQEVVLGIRPEHITIDAEGPLRARVQQIEPWVTERAQIIRARLAESTCVVRAGEDALAEAGDLLPLRFDEEWLHLFDAQTGNRLR
ncbi:MAG: ABC transporter ATP-binding protein [Anaerolineae bacterium]